ncbi:MAG: T9SS type A sorting domain-containing protein [Saprospiraceae bacterium]
MYTINLGKTKLLMAFYFMSMFLLTDKLSAQGGPCDSIKFILENYQPCCYRLNVDNSLIECYNQLRLIIDAGSYSSFQANTSSGWTCSKISPTELLVTHSSGKVPKGKSIPVTFCLEPGFDPMLSILWDNNCAQLGCFADFPLKGCPIVTDACIIGVVYRECDQAIYSNQIPLPNFTINLLDDKGTILTSTVTDSTGEYSFCDLPLGNYIVKEANKPGWTPRVPPSGQYSVTLLQSEIAVRNFGNCPICSCDSIYLDVVEENDASDSCFYRILIQNTGGYCFENVRVKCEHTTVNASKSNTFRLTENGWTLTEIDSQNLILYPQNGFIPIGVTYPLRIYIESGEIKINVKSYYQNGGVQQECTKDFSFICPRIVTPGCCPTGTIQGPELVVNGNFESPGTGPIGFTDCFPWFNPGTATSIGSYSVLQSNQVFAANAQWACTDHTASSPTGKMLVVDGQNVSCNFVWQELISVQPGKEYSFCAFVNNLVIPTKNYDDPIVQLWINNTQVQTISLAESPDQWQSLSALWPSGTSTTALLQIRLGSPTVIGNDFAVDDISFRSCTKDSCICGPYDFMYGIGRGPLLPYHCNDTLSVPSSGAIVPIRFFSFFSCIGSNCPQATVDWILTGPAPFIPISMNNVNATPAFTVPITNATFAYPGLYTLTVIGYCNGKPCPPCTIYFNADGHDCCSNQTDFELGITNAVTISIDNDKCKATLNIGNLPKCDSIGPIFWGDSTASQGHFTAGTMPMHTYAGNGTYYITWTATEYDYSVMPPIKCFEKVFRDSITLICDTCQCKSFSNMIFANFNWTTPNIAVTCGQNSIQLPCIKPGQNFWLHGFLNCNAQSCLKGSINWSISIKNGPSISFGTTSYANISNGHFDITLNPTLFIPNVQYEIIVTGNCGSKVCKCILDFSFAPCPCLCGNFQQEVSQGFFVSGNNLGCKRTIKPIALCANDKVTWLVSPSITPAPANSIGNNSQVFNFPNSGVYTVCMFVTRIDDNLVQCTESNCRTITVNCFPNPHLRLCETSAIKNGDFTEGRIEGHLGFGDGGKIDDWKLFPNNGDGLVYVSDSSGASDDGSVILMGNKSNFAGIWQQVDLTSDNFINIGFDFIDYLKTTKDTHIASRIVIRLQNDSTLNASSSIDMLRKDVLDTKTSRYQRFDTTLNFQYNPELKYLVICLQNENDSVLSVIGLDNIEICTSKVPLSTYSEQLGKLRIYPNPSNGNFTIEMQKAPTSDMKFRIIDLTGRNVLEKQTANGIQIQHIDASKLASGFYFLQVVSKGKVIAVEKLMKQ